MIRFTSTALSVLCLSLFTFGVHASMVSIQEEQLIAEYNEQHNCLALNLYHEARGDSALGQKAVGLVTLNRVHDKRYPNTVCDVVYQSHYDSNGNPIRNKCQFSWWCDGKDDTPKDELMWQKVSVIAHNVIADYGIVEDFTEGAIMYHASYVNPYWSDSLSLIHI